MRPCERRCRRCPGKRERYWPRAAKTCSSAWHRRESNYLPTRLFPVLYEGVDRQIEGRLKLRRESGRDLPVAGVGKSRQVSPPEPKAKAREPKKRSASRNERQRIGRPATEPTPPVAQTWRLIPSLLAA